MRMVCMYKHVHMKNCSECKIIIQNLLATCQDWETKYKFALNQALEVECSSDTLSPFDFQKIGHEGIVQNELKKHKIQLDNQETIRACTKCNKIYQRKFYGDERGEKAFADATYYRNHPHEQTPNPDQPKLSQNHLFCRQCGKNSGKNYFCASNCGKSVNRRTGQEEKREDYDKKKKNRRSQLYFSEQLTKQTTRIIKKIRRFYSRY